LEPNFKIWSQMKIFIRTLAFILLLGTTIVFVLKVRMNIPVTYTHLLIGFVVGAVTLLWTNFRESKENKRNK
jgi:Kef-type K+ transport system membrane component KefB